MDQKLLIEYVEGMEKQAIVLQKFQKHTEQLLSLYSFNFGGEILDSATQKPLPKSPFKSVLQKLYRDQLNYKKMLQNLEESPIIPELSREAL